MSVVSKSICIEVNNFLLIEKFCKENKLIFSKFLTRAALYFIEQESYLIQKYKVKNIDEVLKIQNKILEGYNENHTKL